MMDGMGQGNSYNYLGMPLEAGQIPFTSDQLLALEAQLAPKRKSAFRNCSVTLHLLLLYPCLTIECPMIGYKAFCKHCRKRRKCFLPYDRQT